MINELFTTIGGYFNKIGVGIVILLAGFGLGILAKKLLLRILKEIELNNIMGKVGVTKNIEDIVSSTISYLIYLFTIVYFLTYLGIGSYVLWIILGAVITLVLLTFIVGMKDIIPNFIGWIFIQKKGKMKEGYRVQIREINGTIMKIGFLETEIKTEREDTLYVPNSLFLKSKFKIKK